MKTPEEIQALKEQWIKENEGDFDPWDIEDAHGFEEHRDELAAWAEEYAQNKQAEEAKGTKDPIQWLKDTWTQLRNQTEVNWLESEDYWDIEDHEGYQDHYDELLAWREDFEQNKQAEEVEKANRKRLAELEAADKAAKDMTESFYLDPSVRGSKLADVFRMPGPGKPDAVEMTKLYFQYRQTVALESIAKNLGLLYQYGITANRPEY